MIRNLVNDKGFIYASVEAEPVCGKDFCDTCGDCLACCDSNPCYGNSDGEHLWVEYDV